jgi:hypothetical protein
MPTRDERQAALHSLGFAFSYNRSLFDRAPEGTLLPHEIAARPDVSVSEQPAAEVQASPGRKVYISKTAMHWLLEGLFIVVGVVLGFGIAAYGERRQERELAARVLQGLHDEITYNITQLEPALAKHVAWAEGITKWLQTYAVQGAPRPDEPDARDVFLSTWPGVDVQRLDLETLELPFPVLRRAAWDTAVSTGALRLIDYDVTAALSEIYAWQDALPAIPTGDVAFFDAAQLIPATIRTSFAMEALVISENTLLKLYVEHLPTVREAAERAN